MGTRCLQMAAFCEDGMLVGVIGDADTCSGFLLVGVGDLDRGKGSNYIKVDGNTETVVIEEKFEEMCSRDDIAILVINQWIADKIDSKIRDYNQLIPTIVLVPSKDKPYDPSGDPVYARIQRMMGRG